MATTLFRIAQEAVTNARRHARAVTTIDVSVTHDAASAHLTVIDDGQPIASANTGGHGLRGMSERAELLGGTVDAGPRPEGGWMLHATIPLRGFR